MLTRFWFQTSNGLGYGVTAETQEVAESMLESFGYPLPGQAILGVVKDVRADQLDQRHVLPNVGLLPARGVWFPNHNVSVRA